MATTRVVPPKNLNLNTPTVRNLRTLIWLQNQSTAVNWSKWDGIVCGLDAYKYWSKHNAKIVGIVVTEPNENTDEFLVELFEASKHVAAVILSQKVLSLKTQDYWSANYENALSIDILVEQYPFLRHNWNDTNEDAIAMYAMLSRYNRLMDCSVTSDRLSAFDGNITVESGAQPNQVWMVTQYFKHKDARRHKEIRECLARNAACPHIDKIVLINERDFSNEFAQISGADKIQQIVTGKRLTYADFLEFTHDKVPENVYIILCNADIYFGDSLLDLWKVNMADQMLTLLRWDVDEAGKSTLFGPRADSQDTWIFLSNSIRSRTWDYSKFSFQIGQAGCDNAFAGQILRYRFLLSNPSMTFKTYHLHNTNNRTYKTADSIRSDIYINIAPSYIIDTKQEIVPKTGVATTLSNDLVSFEVKSSSMSNEITYCTMLEKEGRYKWEPSVENHYFEAAMPLYSWKNACVTPNGLVYDLYNIYKGKHAEEPRFNYWASANVNIFTPLQKRAQMLAVPFNNTDIFKNPDMYILNYVARCARLLQQYPSAAFWIPRPFLHYLEYFKWGSATINGIYFNENTACWAEEVVGYLPSPAVSELSGEDIAALRAILPSWNASIEANTKICAVVVANAIDAKLVETQITPLLQSLDENWVVRYVYENEYASYDSLVGASLCILHGGKKCGSAWSKLWALPVGCRVIEFQQELQIDGEFQHLAHVAGLKSWVLLLAKGTLADVQEQIMEQLTKWFRRNADEV